MSPLPREAPIQEMVEPRTKRPYLLYVPSTYSDRREWPLVFACHGTNPYDTAPHQIREWASFAQGRGIIVVAPYLTATRGDFPPPADKQVALQTADEEAVLGMLSAVRGTYRIAPEQIFMTGWSAAAYVILDTGLKHPDLFRALAIRQGTFDASFMSVRDDQMSRWQPVMVIFGKSDFLRDQSKEMMAWLEAKGMFVCPEEVEGPHRRLDPGKVWGFFQKIVKERPWIQIRVAQPDSQQPRKIRFRAEAIPAALEYKWHFGDGAESREAEPTHTYADRGRYEVTLNIRLKGNHKFQRTRTLWVDDGPMTELSTGGSSR